MKAKSLAAKIREICQRIGAALDSVHTEAIDEEGFPDKQLLRLADEADGLTADQIRAIAQHLASAMKNASDNDRSGSSEKLRLQLRLAHDELHRLADEADRGK